MKKITFLLTTILFVLTACGSPTEEPTPISQGDYIPSPADSNLTRDVVFLDSTDLLTMESFPLQFSLNLKGSLPTPCHSLRISASAPDAENKINIDAYSVAQPDKVCAQVLQPFDVNFSLGSFPTGHYILFVNGTQVAEFEA